MTRKKILIATVSTLAALFVISGFVASYQASSPETWWRTHQRKEACRSAVLAVLADKDAVIPEVRERESLEDDKSREYRWGLDTPNVSAKNALGAPQNIFVQCEVSLSGYVTSLKFNGDPMPVYRRQ